MPGAQKTHYTDRNGNAAWMQGEYDGNYNGENILLAITAVDIESGQPLGRILTGAVAAAGAFVNAAGGVVGDGAFGAITVDNGAQAGVYRVTIVDPAANAGDFTVTRPDGTADGVGTVGVAYNGSINFTLADGAADFVEDDYAEITVTYDDDLVGQYGPLDPAATNGLQTFACFLLHDAAINAATQKAVGVFRGPLVINGNFLPYINALDENELATMIEQAKAKQLIVRGV